MSGEQGAAGPAAAGNPAAGGLAAGGPGAAEAAAVNPAAVVLAAGAQAAAEDVQAIEAGIGGARPLLRVDSVEVSFGGTQALGGVTVEVAAGEFCGLIGPNGAGKSTLFNVVTGFVRPQRGRVLFDGADITRQRAGRRSRSGIRRTFQEVELFDDLTVAENVRVAAGSKGKAAASTIVAELELTEFADILCRKLPGGIRRRVGVARALASQPRLLLLDEPGAGLIQDEVAHLAQLIQTVCKERDTTVVLVDHDMSLIRRVCSRVVVLDFGKVIAQGTPEQIEADEKVQIAYLGTP
jgi:branched-chain amino acid transport system ATP-binding protein